MLTGNEIRQQFLDFFGKNHGHAIVPSSPVVPLDDPTLLFTNAGMNQFKDVFLGTGTRPYKRAVDTQKCIRAGGKHNDLDDVGKDTYHHTFFEMLGNWSFGDYFKKEAIDWAWEALTKVWKLDPTRLHVTVFEGDPANGVPRDDEAATYWHEVAGVPKERIHYGNKKDNFWEMGDTGPCGPCSEVHYDSTPDKSGGPLVNQGTDKVIEIWNLVFIQFNRNADKTLTPLPAKHVDTGMGFERIAKILQGKDSNYDTDIFAPIFQAIQHVAKAPPNTGKLDDLKDTAYRVIGDHIRTLTFALTDGATFGADGRNYVLRRILRRAERYGRQMFETARPFLCDLVPNVVDAMGAAFPELKRDPKRVIKLIREEEESFIRTLDRGIKLFQGAASEARQSGGNRISGAKAFELHDTYGVYIDIIEQMASEAGLTVDREGFEREMKAAKEKARGARKKVVIAAVQGDLPKTDDAPKYGRETIKARVVGWIQGNVVVREGVLEAGENVALLLDRTNFYAEQGGQVGDLGTISAEGVDFEVEDTQKLGDSVLHLGVLHEGPLKVGQAVTARVGPLRSTTMKNHTATHILNLALRAVLGDHVEQKGSLVDADKTRFDFSHDKPLSTDELRGIEEIVNRQIQADLPVTAVTMPLAEAKKLPGVRAVFGEKYPDPVRVVLIGPDSPAQATREHSIEFCGGTHLARTGQAGLFKIVAQELVAKGVRRVTAVTGPVAVETVKSMAAVLDELTGRFNCRFEELPARIDALREEVKKLQEQLKKGAATDLAGAGDRLFEAAIDVKGAKIIVGEAPAASVEQLRNQVDRLRQKAGSAVVVLGWKEDDKAGLMAGVTEDLIKKGIKAGALVGEAAKAIDGKGGGKPDLAQAGGKSPGKLAEALALAKKLATELVEEAVEGV